MSKYTTELRHLIDAGYDLGMQEYEIFDETYRSKLNDRIKKFFYFREIGFQAPGKFVFKLNQKLDLIMPKYNKIFESELLKADPLLSFQSEMVTNESRTKESEINESDSENRDETKEQIGELTNTSKSESVNNSNTLDKGKENANQIDNVENHNKTVGSKTPNEDIQGYDIDSFTFADEIGVGADTSLKSQSTNTENENNQESNSFGEVTNQSDGNTSNNESLNSSVDRDKQLNENSSETYVNTVTRKGLEVNIIDLVDKYNEVFKTVDQMIIDDLRDLFMLVY